MKNIIISVLLLGSSIGQAEVKIPSYITSAAKVFNVSPALLYSMCIVESQCNPKAVNNFDSKSGSYSPSLGLFQIKLNTARMMGYGGDAAMLLNPSVNAYYAAKLLRKNLNKYKGVIQAVSAHNAGTASDKNYLYVQKVINYYFILTLNEKN